MQKQTRQKSHGSFVARSVDTGAVLCREGRFANTFVTRLFGLLGKKSLPDGQGLLIEPSSGVHTFGMSFPIDIVALDGENNVVGAFERIGPWKVRGLGRKTRSVLELPAGRIYECGVRAGDRIELEKR